MLMLPHCNDVASNPCKAGAALFHLLILINFLSFRILPFLYYFSSDLHKVPSEDLPSDFLKKQIKNEAKNPARLASVNRKMEPANYPLIVNQTLVTCGLLAGRSCWNTANHLQRAPKFIKVSSCWWPKSITPIFVWTKNQTAYMNKHKRYEIIAGVFRQVLQNDTKVAFRLFRVIHLSLR